MSAAELAGGFAPPLRPGRPAASRTGSGGGSTRSRPTPGGSCSSRRPIPWASRCWCGERPSGSGSSGGRDAGARGRPARDRRSDPLPSSAGALGGLSLGIPRPSATRCTRRSPRPPMPRSIPTGARGTAPRRHRARRGGRRGVGALGRPAPRRAEASLRPPPSLRRRRRSRPTPPIACAACSRRRKPSATPARSTRRCDLLSAAEAGPLSAVQAAEVEHLRGEIAFDERRVGDATRLLVSAAKRLEPLTPELARTTHLEALGAAIWAGRPGRASRGGRSRPRRAAGARPADAVDVVLDALALRLTDGLRGGRARAGARA